MNREIVGIATEDEKNEIMVLFERKIGIEELTATLDSNILSSEQKEIMIDKMISESGKVKLKMQAWWDKMYEKYKWRSDYGYNWGIDFNTCEIYLAQ